VGPQEDRQAIKEFIFKDRTSYNLVLSAPLIGTLELILRNCPEKIKSKKIETSLTEKDVTAQTPLHY
jgi:hypothetical protein